jgi:hypothetical protein
VGQPRRVGGVDSHISKVLQFYLAARRRNPGLKALQIRTFSGILSSRLPPDSAIYNCSKSEMWGTHLRGESDMGTRPGVCAYVNDLRRHTNERALKYFPPMRWIPRVPAIGATLICRSDGQSPGYPKSLQRVVHACLHSPQGCPRCGSTSQTILRVPAMLP